LLCNRRLILVDFESLCFLFAQWWKINEAVLDENHPDLAISYNNISLIYQALGDLPRASEYARRSVQIFQANFEDGHPSLETARKLSFTSGNCQLSFSAK
jgi:tetratricopeptide (TPR) repeat protein